MDINTEFERRVAIGSGGFITTVFAAILIGLFFVWPAFIWDNGLVRISSLIGVLLFLFFPVLSSNNDIEAHEAVKELYGKVYENLREKYEVVHPNKRAVFWITLLLGWTSIGWLVAMYMFTAKKEIELPIAFIDELNQLVAKDTTSFNDTENQVNLSSQKRGDIPAGPITVTCEFCGGAVLTRKGACQQCGAPV